MTQHQAQRTVKQTRQAVTLVELMLVLGLIILILSLALPSLYGSWQASRVRYTADQLSTHLAQARIRAMTSGQTLMLNYTENQYEISVAAELADEIEASTANAGEYMKQVQLPEGMIFSNVVTYGDQRAEAVQAQTGATATAYFYPDGSTSTIELSIENSRGTSYTVSLRGLTGVALVSENSLNGSTANPYLVGRGASGATAGGTP